MVGKSVRSEVAGLGAFGVGARLFGRIDDLRAELVAVHERLFVAGEFGAHIEREHHFAAEHAGLLPAPHFKLHVVLP